MAIKKVAESQKKTIVLFIELRSFAACRKQTAICGTYNEQNKEICIKRNSSLSMLTYYLCEITWHRGSSLSGYLPTQHQ